MRYNILYAAILHYTVLEDCTREVLRFLYSSANGKPTDDSKRRSVNRSLYMIEIAKRNTTIMLLFEGQTENVFVRLCK